jgi:hypothetical protein
VVRGDCETLLIVEEPVEGIALRPEPFAKGNEDGARLPAAFNGAEVLAGAN